MSRATKRKHVLREALKDDFSPPTENQQIVKVLFSKGNNLHEVEAADKSVFLVSMPTKFRKLIWVKRGSYILIEPIKEGRKVKAEIVKILTPEHIKCFKNDNVWPKEFDTNEEKKTEDDEDDFVNPNRRVIESEESGGSDSEDNSDESSDLVSEENSDESSDLVSEKECDTYKHN